MMVEKALERFKIMSTSNDKREFVPLDQVSPLLVTTQKSVDLRQFYPKQMLRTFLSSQSDFYLESQTLASYRNVIPNLSINPLSANIHIEILQNDLHTFPLRIK